MTVKAFETPNLGVLLTEVTEETDTTWFVRNPRYLQIFPDKEGNFRPAVPLVVYKEFTNDGEYTTSFEKGGSYKDITSQIKSIILDFYKQEEGFRETEPENVVELFGGEGECCGETGCGCEGGGE